MSDHRLLGLQLDSVATNLARSSFFRRKTVLSLFVERDYLKFSLFLNLIILSVKTHRRLGSLSRSFLGSLNSVRALRVASSLADLWPVTSVNCLRRACCVFVCMCEQRVKTRSYLSCQQTFSCLASHARHSLALQRRSDTDSLSCLGKLEFQPEPKVDLQLDIESDLHSELLRYTKCSVSCLTPVWILELWTLWTVHLNDTAFHCK